VNAIVNALYAISAGRDSVASVIIDQNNNSGSWISLGRYTFPANVQIQVRVIDNSLPVSNRVLRADAIKFQLLPVTSVADKSSSGVIGDFILSQNFPNPFNPTTTIVYKIAKQGQVSLTVYDILGRVVAILVNSDQAQGIYTLRFDASQFSSGIYFYQLRASGLNETRKMLIAK